MCELSLLGEAGELEEIKEAFTIKLADFGVERVEGMKPWPSVSPTLVEASFLLRIKKNIEAIMGDVSSVEEFRRIFNDMRRQLLENDKNVMEEALKEGVELDSDVDERLTEIDILEITHWARVKRIPLSWLIADIREMQSAFCATRFDENHFPTAERPWRKVVHVPTPREALALIRLKREIENQTGREFLGADDFKLHYDNWKKQLN